MTFENFNPNATQAQERAQVAESEARGEQPAERPVEDNVGPGGMSLGRDHDGSPRREIAGGGSIQEHELNAPTVETIDPLYFHRRYINSRLAKEAGNIIGRSPENIGFWGKGMTYRGNGGILVDVDTLEKHRFPDGFRFEGDEVYANSRDLPPSLVTGDVTKNLSGENAAARA